MMASGMPFTNTAMSAMTCFFVPRTRYWRVTATRSRRVLEVEEADRVPSCRRRDPAPGRCRRSGDVQLLVRLGEAGGRTLVTALIALSWCRQPRIQLRSAFPAGRGLSPSGSAARLRVRRRDVGVAEERSSSTAGSSARCASSQPGRRAHAASESGVTRTAPVRRTDIRAA
jgi:hypothetical protein